MARIRRLLGPRIPRRRPRRGPTAAATWAVSACFVIGVVIAIVTGAVAPGTAIPAHAQSADPVGSGVGAGAKVVELVPHEGTVLRYRGRSYAGRLELRRHSDGLAVIEHVTLDDYLAGIREVPFDWPAAALEAQAVAARTFLAWTLERGRAGAGRVYGFDICATTQCQVYAGSGQGRRPETRPWIEAVSATAGQILMYDGGPAQTLYSSSAGSRTRANQDVFGGRPLPYLQPVDSPESGVTPYEQWEVTLPEDVFAAIVREAGYALDGKIEDVSVARRPEGEGPASLVIESTTGVFRMSAYRMRWDFNRIGPRRYPGLLPAARPTRGRWPQAILSYTFDAAFTPGSPVPARVIEHLPDGDLPATGVVTIVGEGWGHGVGMSQWGAKAMADAGATAQEILAHYYGGLEPRDGSAVLPDTVAVGLDWGVGEVTIDAGGGFDLVVDGIAVDVLPAGDWGFRAGPRGIVVLSPPGIDAGRFSGPWPR